MEITPAMVKELRFGWVKSLFRWDDIEHDYKEVAFSANADGTP